VTDLEVVAVTKAYAGRPAVDDVSFAVAEGEVLALLGPSGSGKSTLLGLIAGLDAPDAGDIRWAGRSLLGAPTHRRGFGLMFQDYALFPHKDVAENVGFGLRMQGQPPAEVAAGVRWALELVGLAGFERRDVNTLSGGEQQRVALARALAPHPRLLMLDEPLGALDRALRARLLGELRAILRRLRQTAIYVTHDQEEAFALADHVVILAAGRVAQRGTPAEVYARPASRFVAEFLGQTNLLPARLEVRAGQPVAVTPIGEFPIKDEIRRMKDEAQMDVHPSSFILHPFHVLLRPEGVALAGEGEADLEAVVVDESFRGSRCLVVAQAGDARLTFEFPAGQALPGVGHTLRLRIPPSAVYLLPA
jgi:ABC-type Fe3+/spermidine/putrescine transport system ATPase subunit